MTDRFSELLSQLGKVFHLSLHPDKSNACSIKIPPVTIQLQLDSTQERMFLFSKIIEIPPGKFRENVLRDALKANGLPDPRPGVLAFIASTNHLALYQRYPLEILNGERLAAFFGSFFEMAESWHKTIQNGQSSPLGISNPPFGVRP